MKRLPVYLGFLFCLFLFVLSACSDDSSSPVNSSDSKKYTLLATDGDGISIDIKEDQRARIRATGTVNTNPDGPVTDCDLWTDANGIESCNYVWTEMMCRGLPFMALIGTCGADSFLVGTDFDSTFTSDVQLNLLINDWVHTDNEGQFEINVTLE